MCSQRRTLTVEVNTAGVGVPRLRSLSSSHDLRLRVGELTAVSDKPLHSLRLTVCSHHIKSLGALDEAGSLVPSWLMLNDDSSVQIGRGCPFSTQRSSRVVGERGHGEA